MSDIKFRVSQGNKTNEFDFLELPIENVLYENLVMGNRSQELWELLLSVFGGNEEVEEEEFFFRNKFVQQYRKTINNDLQTLKDLLKKFGLNSDIIVNHLIYDSKSKSLQLNHDLISETIDEIFKIPLILAAALKERNKEWFEFWRKTNFNKATLQPNETSIDTLIRKIKIIKKQLKISSKGLAKVTRLQVQKELDISYGIKKSTFYEILKKHNIDFDSI